MLNWKKIKIKILLHTRRIYVIILNFLFGHDFVFLIIGLIFRTVGMPIKSAFLLYPGHRKYSEAYVYKWYRNQMQWKPRLIGFLWQNGRLSLTFAISACDKDIWSDSGVNLQKTYDRIKHIKEKLGADQMSFAGILPGVLMAKDIMTHSIERDVTVPSVIKAIDMVKKRENMPADTVIIVLGANGFIGQPIVQALRNNSDMGAVLSLDLGSGDEFSRLKIESAIILNVTKKGGLRNYIPNMHPGMLVLNEVYPPPHRNVVKKIKATGAKIFHINGIKGGAFPAFPHDYAGGIPCCAGHIPEKADEIEVIISEL